MSRSFAEMARDDVKATMERMAEITDKLPAGYFTMSDYETWDMLNRLTGAQISLLRAIEEIEARRANRGAWWRK